MWGLQFSPAAATAGARLLASASNDTTAAVWDVSDPRVPRLLHTLSHDEAVRTVAFSPDGALLATSCHDRTVKLWRVADGALLHTLPAQADFVSSVAFHPRDASLLATSDLNLWQL
jgi:WD40 repeat protein